MSESVSDHKKYNFILQELFHGFTLHILIAFLTLFFFTDGFSKSFVDVAWMIPVFPIVAFIFILFFGHYDPRKGGSIALIGVGLSSIFSLSVAYEVLITDSLHGEYEESVSYTHLRAHET